MSRMSKLTEVVQMDDDTVIQGIRGTLKVLFKPKTGESDKGPWSFQNGEISDGKTTLKITFNNRDELPQTFKGKEIVVLAYHGEKGWSGCYKKTDEYQGRNKPMVWVTKTGEVILAKDYSDEGGGESKAEPSDNDGGTGDEGDLPPQRHKVEHPAEHDTSKPGNQPVYGATVGMALKESIGIVREIGTDPFSPDFYRQVMQVASEIIRCARLLEDGRLMPTLKSQKSEPKAE